MHASSDFHCRVEIYSVLSIPPVKVALAPDASKKSKCRTVEYTSLTLPLFKPLRAMFIAIVGTPSSGKRTVLEYLKSQHGFQEITLTTTPSEVGGPVQRFVLLRLAWYCDLGRD